MSNFLLRLGLTAVFLWFGIDKFFHPVYWLDAWVPKWLISSAVQFGINEANLVFLFGVFEVLVGVSLISAVFLRFFSFLAAVFLISIIVFAGIDEVTVRDIGLLGGFLSLLFWPPKSGHIR